MTYRTLMVHLDIGADNRAVLAVTADLARRFGTGVIGIAAARPQEPFADPGYGGLVPVLIAPDDAPVEQALSICEQQFHKAMQGCRGEIEWRSEVTITLPLDYITEQARAADLIITGPTLPFSVGNGGARLDIGALAINAGRPVLLVPPQVQELALRNVVAAWKDGRSARRAFTDGLPFLLEAEHVGILAVGGLDDLKPIQARLDDVARWLARHGVHAVAAAVVANTVESDILGEELARRAPDLVVAGAYGHSRLNEWVFGGVTRNVLLDAKCCVLLSN